MIELFDGDEDEEENNDFLFYDLHERPPELLEPQLVKAAITVFSAVLITIQSHLY